MQPAYYADPEYFERLDGRSYPKVSPKSTHALVQLAFGSLLRELARGYGKVLTELRCRVGAADGSDSYLLPDVAVIIVERWRSLATDCDREEPPFAPDIAVEIRSPGESARLRERKIARYLATGAVVVFGVDPPTRTLRAHTATGAQTHAISARYADAHFPWLQFRVAELFVDLDD
jgi:Uma2 family endonuclease